MPVTSSFDHWADQDCSTFASADQPCQGGLVYSERPPDSLTPLLTPFRSPSLEPQPPSGWSLEVVRCVSGGNGALEHRLFPFLINFD